ncbi:type III secretion protein [Hyphomicrobium methylovorum]|uniref:flagellar biosynthetic protein FliR n=1 Tax=Hyphomicrobium methylovorum TaxID=84 RepID=UPI0015E69556|nr:flagellar biosynthetic protein FliR [Hyphomicrobium methylovorum]MBA2125920.1 type III secretion protein [Hyphomicrobium methylovorum]
MSELTQQTILVPLIVFCRVGACFMVLPGISSERIPMQVRLFVAIAVGLALTPLVYDQVFPITGGPASGLLGVIVSETLAGAFLGFMVRIFYMALEFAAIAMANLAGYGSAFSHAVEGNDPSTPFSAFITLPAVTLFFITDQHLNIIAMLQSSFQVLQVGSGFALPPDLTMIVTTFGSAFRLTLQLSAALVIYSLMVNLAFGFLNKMIPQIPSFFVSTPFVVFGGLVILLQIDKSMLEIFSSLVQQAINNLARNG